MVEEKTHLLSKIIKSVESLLSKIRKHKNSSLEETVKEFLSNQSGKSFAQNKERILNEIYSKMKYHRLEVKFRGSFKKNKFSKQKENLESLYKFGMYVKKSKNNNELERASNTYLDEIGSHCQRSL